MAVPDIGSRFHWCGLTYEVVESADGTCKGCSFMIPHDNFCIAFHSRWATPDCQDNSHSVIFKLLS